MLFRSDAQRRAVFARMRSSFAKDDPLYEKTTRVSNIPIDEKLAAYLESTRLLEKDEKHRMIEGWPASGSGIFDTTGPKMDINKLTYLGPGGEESIYREWEESIKGKRENRKSKTRTSSADGDKNLKLEGMKRRIRELNQDERIADAIRESKESRESGKETEVEVGTGPIPKRDAGGSGGSGGQTFQQFVFDTSGRIHRTKGMSEEELKLASKNIDFYKDLAKIQGQERLRTQAIASAIPVATAAGAYGAGAALGGASRVAGIPGEIVGGALKPVRAIGRGIRGAAAVPGELITGAARGAGGVLGFAGREAGETAQAFGRTFGEMAGGVVRDLPVLLSGLAKRGGGEIYDLSLPFLQQYSTPTPVSQMKPIGGIEVPPGSARFREKLWGDYGFRY